MAKEEFSPGGLRGFDPANLFKNGFTFGGGDLIQGGSLREVVGRATAALLMAKRVEDGRHVFRGGTIIVPPSVATTTTEEDVFSALHRAILDFRGSPIAEDEAKVLRRILRVQHAPSLRVADVLHLISQLGPEGLVVVAQAHRFRDLTIKIPMAFGATAIRLPEDRWAPHVASLCQQIGDALNQSKGYVLVHVPEIPASKPVNKQLLESVDNFAVYTLSYGDDANEVVAARCSAWISLVIQGRLEEVMEELAKLDMSEGERLHILLQVVNRTGRRAETLDLVRRFQPHLPSLTKEISVQAALFALNAGDEDLAQELLPVDPSGIGEQVWLEDGLEVATQLNDDERIASFDACLNALVPDSERLQENRDRRLLVNCEEATPRSGHRFTTAGFTAHHLTLLQQLSTFQPDYNAVIEVAETWGRDWLELAVVCCAMHAKGVGRYREAADVASRLTRSELYGRQATQVVLYSVRALMLRELVPVEERDDYRRLVQSAIEFMASAPADDGIRLNLVTLLSPETCGDQGMPLIALTMLDLTRAGVPTPPEEAESPAIETDLFNESVKASIANVFGWMNEVGSVEAGVSIAPRELVVAPPDDVVNLIGKLAHRTSGQSGEDVDLVYLERLTLAACAICPFATRERDADIRLLRVLAAQNASVGQLQRARDLAEQILLLGQTSPLRTRLAWASFGDVYHRCRNHVLALVGMACALATNVEVTKADVWHEVYTIHRILRDIGIFELSREFLPAMRSLIKDLGFDPVNDPRIVASELSLDLMQAFNASLEDLQALMAKLVAASRSALGDRNQLYPFAMLLGQAVAKVEAAGGVVTAETRTILDEALIQVGNQVASTIKTISAEKPSVDSVLEMFNGVQRAAFASDVARDYAYIGTAARRLLNPSHQAATGVTDAAFAVELLGDQAVKLRSDAPAMTADWAMQYALELNDAGCDVVFIALDSEDELSVTHVGRSEAYAIPQPKHDQTFKRRFDAWLTNYPSGYGKVDTREGNNTFYLTMETLDIRLPPAERLVVVAEPILQQLAANLVVMPPEDGGFSYFAGSRCAIGAAPSLTWLATTRMAQRTGKTAYKAWISAQPDSDFSEGQEQVEVVPKDAEAHGYGRAKTLDVTLSRLSGSFVDFGFAVDTGRRLPRDMADAGLAVVTAHGGLNREGRFLHSIRDDDKLVEAPSALANALAGVEVIILFVCSGGRIDKNPWDNTTTSLPKQLLNSGARAVIASPWPLNVLVTYNWLEPFLRAWEEGATVLDATKSANDVVATRLGDFPQYSMAMRVYGDVLLTRD